MHDKWSKKLTDDRTVVYTSEFLAGNGGVITEYAGEMVRTRNVQIPMTRKR
jgi:hypothetical protein